MKRLFSLPRRTLIDEEVCHPARGRAGRLFCSGLRRQDFFGAGPLFCPGRGGDVFLGGGGGGGGGLAALGKA
jgi:hypothetical protein